jgi:hypothetical protein
LTLLQAIANVLGLVTIHWLFTIAALLLALGAVLRTRRQARRIERLTESYWELRYEYSQLRAQVTRLETPAGDAASEPETPMRPVGGGAFIPLSSLKR